MSDDVLSNVDAVSKALDKIDQKLKSVSSTMGEIGKSSGTASKNLTAAAGGTFTGNPVGGSGKSVGSGTALFDSSASFGEGPPERVGDNPNAVQRFATARPRAFMAGMAVLGAGAAAWSALPGVDEVRSQRQAMFTATLGYGPSSPDFDKLKSNMMDAFGGYATSISSQENVARAMSIYGMSMRPGSNASLGNITGAMGEISAMSLITGQSQESMEAARRSLATGTRANRLYMLGISTRNADGTTKDFGATVKQVMDRTMRGDYTLADVEQGLRPGGILRSNFARMLGPENADLAAQYAQAIVATGSSSGSLTLKQLEEAELTDPDRNPFAAEAHATGTRSQTVSDYSDEVLSGWSKALEAAEAVERVMQNLHGVLAPLAGAKGLGQGLTSQVGTAALLGGIGVGMGGISSAGGMSALLGRAGGARAGGSAGLAARALGGGGGSLLAGGLRAAAKGGVAAIGGSLATEFAFSKLGTDAESSDDAKLGATLLKILANTGTGALAGGLVGGGIPGALIGGGIGLATSLWDVFVGGQGVEYGSKASSLFGEPGHGEGDSGGGAGQQKPAEKQARGRSGSGAGTVAGALAFARQAAAGKKANWKNLCQRFAANCYGLPRGHYSSASQAWRSIPKQYKSPGERSAPAGGLYYWTGGSSGYGHVAVSMGDGTMACNAADGRIHIKSNAWMFNYYRNLKFEGWAQPYFGRLITSVGASTGATAAATTGDVDVDGGGQPTGGRSMDTVSGAQGMSAVSVRPWGADMISASPYGGIAATQYSIAANVSSSLEGLMGGGNLILSGGDQVSEEQSRSVGSESLTGDDGERGVSGRAGSFSDSSAPGKGKGVSRWEGVARNAMAAAGLPDKYFNLLMHRMHVESSGNPNAINDWDSNAKKGTPSIGLMQVIKPTFDAYAGPYKDRGQYDPFANIYAAIKYSLSRYGESGLERAWGGRKGYSEGAWRISKDQVADIHQGEMIIPAATAEIVRTNVRKAQAGQLDTGSSGGGGGTRKVEITINTSGHVYSDARKLAKEVGRILREEDELASIGGF